MMSGLTLVVIFQLAIVSIVSGHNYSDDLISYRCLMLYYANLNSISQMKYNLSQSLYALGKLRHCGYRQIT